MVELRVGGKYKLRRKLGSGAFGDIYHGIFLIGINIKTNEEVAIKLVHLIRNLLKLIIHNYSMKPKFINIYKEEVIFIQMVFQIYTGSALKEIITSW